MATKLKKMRLTSVDLVRAGANQEADICLYKSADPQEAAEGPTEDEMNIFKRFIAFIRGTPTEAKNEPHSHIEKAQEPERPADYESIYKSALADSIHSIYTDDNLSEVEKKAMTEQSIGQFQEKMKEVLRDSDDEPEDWDDDHEDDPDDDDLREDDRYDDIEEIEVTVHKYNHNHGRDGKFTSSGGGGGGAAPAAGSDGRSSGADKDGLFNSKEDAKKWAKTAHDQGWSEGIILERDGKYGVAHNWKEYDYAKQEGWKLSPVDDTGKESETGRKNDSGRRGAVGGKGNMSNEDVQNNVAEGLSIKDTKPIKAALSDIRQGDSVTLSAKTYKGNVYETKMTSNGDGSFKHDATIKGRRQPSKTVNLEDAADEIRYFSTMTQGARPKITVTRKAK